MRRTPVSRVPTSRTPIARATKLRVALANLINKITLPAANLRGATAERLAARHLRKAGYRIIARNLRTPMGEIDILAEAPDRQTVVFIEVKGRNTKDRDKDTNNEYRPENRVGYHKQRRIITMASYIALKYGYTDRPIRFDVIGIDMPRGTKPVIRHHLGAFESKV